MTKSHPYIVTVGNPDRCVVFGYATTKIKSTDSPTLSRARMVLRWDAACGGLFGLAANGPKKDTRLTAEVTTCPGEVVRCIEVTPEAAAALSEWPAFSG